MNRKERRELARQLVKLENKCKDENNIPENIEKMESLVQGCSFEDLLKIDEMIIKKYLTNN